MATGLNTYAGVYNNEMHGEILRCEAGFTFKDILPKEILPRRFLQSRVHENFRSLVDRANEFLRNNREWKIVTCESVEFRLKNGEVNPLKMTYVEYGESYTSYIRGLRLWLTQRKDEREREQQIGYFNLIPQKLEKDGIFKPFKFETLDMVIGRFNSQLQSNPLPGRIITIESQEMKKSLGQKFDPDISTWYERGNATKSFLFVIRIFYEVMDGCSEVIGVQDFIADKIYEGGMFAWPKFKQFSTVVNKASAWCAQQQDFRFCNAQALEIKVKGAGTQTEPPHLMQHVDVVWSLRLLVQQNSSGKELNTQRMDFTKSGTSTRYYVRVLRVAYTKPLSNRYSISENASPIRELTYRTFEPVQLSNFPKYESLAVTRERISAWVKATGAHVLSAETATYRIKSGGERKQGTEATFSYNSSEKDYDWMFVIRLYLEGSYKEPPPEMLPALPVFEKLCCNVL